ncbi:hypothetical protein LTR37_011505 [Vermiconidia calcicola]|uniref:Uncharacterized protein n=1 Tax=Vermiconidia calcicola TaxID=1690605 RepID=A0ACC3N227_9PEZI|nr:hypothetical protein LTR37_011505 [Vermiconidia calcicola]
MLWPTIFADIFETHTDSGYHGMTEDEIEVDNKTETAAQSSQQSTSVAQKVRMREEQPPPQRVVEEDVEDATGDSFMIAKEDMSRHASKAVPLCMN